MKSIIRLLSLSVLFCFFSCNVETLDNPSQSLEKSTKDPDGCETAFAYADDGCFYNDGFNRWGWVIGPLTAPYNSTHDMYAGAGKCNLEKGTLIGSVSINYEDGTVTVDYNALDGYAFFETHLYVGNDKYPTTPKGKPTVAPGKYGNQNSFDSGSSSDSFTIEGLEGEIYVIAHAVVCPAKIPCEVDPGDIKANNSEPCIKDGIAELSAIPEGNAVVPDGYEVLYVLTQGDGLVIIDVSDTPSFTVDNVGDYTIHTLVYDPNTLDLGIVELGVTTGFDVYALLIDGGGSICAALDVEGASFKVIKCP